MLQDGDVLKAIYCHNDGNLNHNGVILQKAYQDLDKVKKLISLGDLSALGENLEHLLAGKNTVGILALTMQENGNYLHS